MANGPMFERAHHRRIGRVLESLDAALLRSYQCWFGGGTAIALRCGEFRESVDIDFLVSDPTGYRALRQRLRGARDLHALMRDDRRPIELEHEARIDQYGIRAFLLVEEVRIKFEIISEGRIHFDPPLRSDQVCGIASLTRTDLATCKLLANVDRWSDDSVFARDVIDLAMLDLPPRHLKPALDKAAAAYGRAAVVDDLHAALQGLRLRPGWPLRCMQALSINLPAAQLQQKLRELVRRLVAATSSRPE